MFDSLLGLDRAAADLSFENMAARAVITFFGGLMMIRLGARRGLSRSAGFDFLLAVILGSVLSRAINGQAPFWPTLGASALIVFLHWSVSWITARVHWISILFKGRAVLLVGDGKIDQRAMKQSGVSIDDLEENLRLNGNVAQPGQVAEARLERSGQISVVRFEQS